VLFRSRLKNENRLLGEMSGNNTDMSLNFVTKLNRETLTRGYRTVVRSIYTPRNYYARITGFLKDYHPRPHRRPSFKISDFLPLLRSVWYLGLLESGRFYYWRLITQTFLRRRDSLPLAITLAVYGYHFRKVIQELAWKKSPRPT
jgi:hypothetical protein